MNLSNIPNNIEAIVFDIGNVLFVYDEMATAKRFVPHSTASVDEIFQTVFRSKAYKSFMFDFYKYEQYFEIVSKDIGFQLSMDEFFKIFKTVYTEPNEEMVNLLNEAHRTGKKVYILSDIDYILECHLVDNYPWIEKITGRRITASWRHKTTKRQEYMYMIIESYADLKKEKIFFIDDREDNLRVASKRGWQTMLYCAPQAPTPPE